MIGQRDSLDWFVAEGETDARAPLRPRRRRRRDPRAPGRRAHVQARVGGADPARRHASRSATTPTTTATPAPRRPRRSSAARTRARAPARRGRRLVRLAGRPRRVPRARSAAAGAGRASSSRRSSDFLAHPFPKAEPLLGEPGAIFLAVGSLLHGLRRRRHRQEHLDDRRHRAPGRRRRLARHPGAAAGALLRDRERRAAAPLPAEARREDRELGRAATSPTTSSSSVGPWGEFTFADPDAREALIAFCDEHDDRRRHREPDARPRRRRLRPPRRDAAVRRLARRVRPQERAAPSGSCTTRTRPARSPATGAATPTRRC